MSISNAYEKFCTTRFPNITEKDVTYLEDEIGVALPKDYRKYLLEFNGGYFDEPLITPPEKTWPNSWLESMYGIRAPHNFAEIGLLGDILTFDDNVPGSPPVIVPIGNTTKNYLILLDTSPEDNGSIYLRTFTETFQLSFGIEEFFDLLVAADS
ncbi:SMI1 / KNR4 family protein [Symmachiella dynata]|uniref:SMI1 / KNR4 family protein n=1 Tax=Symmachiella dynata TaxID=2527995 RepID=A0A517ZR20_9PLAN|nr:SMI1/KNR4 family protein [Symmachiella dynata]QDU44930.1 SMI1 / KNR4 family protein [Symmachiella dynata]